VSAPYFSAISMAPTTLPLDLDMATPPFCTMPCVKSRANRFIVLYEANVAHDLAPESRVEAGAGWRALCRRCTDRWETIATFPGSNGALSLCGSQ